MNFPIESTSFNLLLNISNFNFSIEINLKNRANSSAKDKIGENGVNCQESGGLSMVGRRGHSSSMPQL